MIDITSTTFWIAILVAIICGGIVGLERQISGKPAGIRTSILICLGTSIFITLGVVHSEGNFDSTRVLGQVVTGIGFLGAGVIIAHGGIVRGITSAAVIWILAGIGSIIGFGHFKEAIILSLLTVLLLTGNRFLESKVSFLRKSDRAQGNRRDTELDE